MELHIIYTETEMLLSKERFSSWREIQDRYADFKTSLGPWEHEAVIEYLSDEYTDLEPPAAVQVTTFLDSNDLTMSCRWPNNSLNSDALTPAG